MSVTQAPKALGYFREDAENGDRSARDAGEPSESLADQSRAFLEFCRHQGYEVAATFLDTSTDSGNPSGFRQLLDYLKEHQGAGCVVVMASIDRLGRDVMQATRGLFQIDGLGARLILLDGTADPASALLEHWSRGESPVNVGERVREAMRKKAIRGEVLGRPPFGYRVGDKHRLEPVPDEAGVVRYIFRLYTRDGLGIRLIARRLNEEGYRTRRGGNWSMITIRDILLNRAYLGTYTRFGVRVPGSHPALISPDDFRRVQDRMASRRTGGGARNVRHFLLSGLAYCGYCGNRMIGVSRRQTWTRQGEGGIGEAEYRYYQCLTRTNQSMCDYHTWRAAALEEAVRARAAEAIALSLASANGVRVSEASTVAEAVRLRQRLRLLDRKLDQHMQSAANRELSLERLRELNVEIMQQQMEIDEALHELDDRQRIVETLEEHRRTRTAQLDVLTTGWSALNFDEQQHLLREVVARAEIFDNAPTVQLR